MVWYLNITRQWMVGKHSPPDITYRPRGRVERRLVKFSLLIFFALGGNFNFVTYMNNFSNVGPYYV